jgi:hypothetical protein
MRGLKRAMLEYEKGFKKEDVRSSLEKASYKCMEAGKNLAKPGAKEREVVKASAKQSPKRFNPDSDKTDTSRKATHFVKFWRQKPGKNGKRFFFVPITKNPIDERGALRDQHRRMKRAKNHSDAVAKFGKGGEGWQVTRQSAHYVYDQDGTISSKGRGMLKIGRRGFAGLSFWYLAGKVQRKHKPSNPKGGLRGAKFMPKYTDYRKDFRSNRPSIMMHSKLTYLQKVYGSNLETNLVRVAAHNMRRELEERIKRRNAKANNKASA